MTAEDMAAVYARALPLLFPPQGRVSATLADPALIEQHRALVAWPALIAAWRKLSFGERFGHEAPSLPIYNGRSVGSPQMVPQATLDAAGDLDRDVRARMGDGRLRVLGYQAPRQLDGAPVLLPADLVVSATAINWGQGTIAAGGMTFLECRVIQAGALAAAEPEPEPEAPATLPALIKVLVALFHEDSAWSGASTSDLAALVAARDSRFRPHAGPAKHGRWGASTLRQRIKDVRAEAKAQTDP